MNHYTYYSYEEWGRGYIGVRSCDCSPEEDLYLGSYTDQTFEPTHKIILSTHETREEATQAEIDLHEFFNVSSNNHFANKANQTSASFYYVPDEKAKEKLSQLAKARTGEKAPMFGKRGKDNPNYGQRRSEASKQKMREAKLGKPSHRKGKTLSESHRKAMSEAAKKRWANKRTVTDG